MDTPTLTAALREAKAIAVKVGGEMQRLLDRIRQLETSPLPVTTGTINGNARLA